jgi:hypothetical protein
MFFSTEIFILSLYNEDVIRQTMEALKTFEVEKQKKIIRCKSTQE